MGFSYGTEVDLACAERRLPAPAERFRLMSPACPLWTGGMGAYEDRTSGVWLSGSLQAARLVRVNLYPPPATSRSPAR